MKFITPGLKKMMHLAMLNGMSSTVGIPQGRLTPELTTEAVRAKTGAKPFDQIFTSDKHGHFNAGKMMRMFMTRPMKFGVVTLPITDELVEYIKGFVELDEKVLSEMSPRRVDEPVFAVEIDDPSPVLIIDGHHRIIKRHSLGLDRVKVILMPQPTVYMIHTPHES